MIVISMYVNKEYITELKINPFSNLFGFEKYLIFGSNNKKTVEKSENYTKILDFMLKVFENATEELLITQYSSQFIGLIGNRFRNYLLDEFLGNISGLCRVNNLAL